MESNIQRIDFVLEKETLVGAEDNEQRFVLALEASSSNTELTKHYERAEKYGRDIDASHVWVVHFSAVNIATELPDIPKPPAGVHVLHLVHDEHGEWSSAFYCEGGTTSKTREVDFSEWKAVGV